MIKVMIVDDMPQIVDYYKLIIEREPDFEVVSTAYTGKSAVENVAKCKPDIILMDIQMETDDAGICATRKIKTDFPEIKVIMLTAHNDSNNITESFVAGASDFLTNNSSVVEIINTIRESVSERSKKNDINRVFVEEFVKLKSEKESLLYALNLISRLSRSEIQILALICKGKSYRDIAKERFVEEVTIRSMVNKIKKKLEVNSLQGIVNMFKDTNILLKIADNGFN